MQSLKSIKLYFFSILELVLIKSKNIYLKSSYYNKTLLTKKPKRIFYIPSPFLLSPLITDENKIYKITGISLDSVWETKSKNKFEFENLHAFLWLTKLDRKSSKASVQKIITSWIDNFFNYNKQTWEMVITAKRIISWVSNTDIALQDSNNLYKEQFFSCLVKQSNYLLKNIKKFPYNFQRIICCSAIILSGLIFKETRSNFRNGIKELEKTISIYFDKNGFPKSRNTEAVFISLQYLILIREWLKEAQELIPEFLDNIILKCGNCYSFLSNSNKKFPLFNGANEVDHSKYDPFLKNFKYKFRDETKQNGGYVKFKKKQLEFFFDAGNPPSSKFSNNYQAGCLSFELISNGNKIICNSGYGKYLNSQLSSLSRSTAAHSTLYLNNTSSSLFRKNNIIKKVYGNTLIENHRISNINIKEDHNAHMVCASHNGYEKRYGYVHNRTIKILKHQDKILGTDELKKIKKYSKKISYFIRFHTYPGIKITKTKGGKSILISLSNGEGWILKSNSSNLYIEKNIFFGKKKIVANECIFITGFTDEPKILIDWTIEKLS